MPDGKGYPGLIRVCWILVPDNRRFEQWKALWLYARGIVEMTVCGFGVTLHPIYIPTSTT